MVFADDVGSVRVVASGLAADATTNLRRDSDSSNATMRKDNWGQSGDKQECRCEYLGDAVNNAVNLMDYEEYGEMLCINCGLESAGRQCSAK